jgi:hypothetical protein
MFTFHFEPDKILVNYALWAQGPNVVINQTRVMKDRPHVVSAFMNGYIQNMAIYTPTEEIETPMENKCYKGCNRCSGREPNDAIECESGYTLIDLPDNGQVCKSSVKTMRIIAALLGIGIVYLIIRQWMMRPVAEKEYKCKNHVQPATHIVHKCGHLLCEDCFLPFLKKKSTLACPICLETAKGIYPLSETFPKKTINKPKPKNK